MTDRSGYISRLADLGIGLKILLPFSLVLLGSIGWLATAVLDSAAESLHDSLNKRAEIMATILAPSLADPLSMGEMDRLQAVVAAAKEQDPDVRYVHVIDDLHTVLATTEPELRGRELMRSDFERRMANVDHFVRAPIPDSDGSFEVAIPIDFAGSAVGTLRIGVSPERVSGIVERLRSSAVLIAGIALGLGILVCFAVTRQISSLLARAAGVMEDVASGDLSGQLEIMRGDEIGRMARALDASVRGIREALQSRRVDWTQLGTQRRQLERTAGSLSAASESLSSVATNLSNLVVENSEQSTAVSRGAREVSDSLTSVSSATSELASTTRDIASQASKAAEVGRQAMELAATTNSMIDRLGDSSKEIGQVINLITNIAEKTNLLALNATIESARAGSAGKGFAVVANEVKELARQTGEATTSVGERIGAIQSDTRAAVDAINRTSEIIAEINRVQDAILQAVENQAATTNEISTRLSSAVDTSGEISTHIECIASGARNAESAAEEVQKSASSMSDLATELGTLIR